MKYQPPPPCPANYVPRLEIINEIGKVIVEDAGDENTTIRIGITVTIRGIGGIGKSTLAKALCYHPHIKEYFTHGFLWISLTPPCLSPEATLRDVYNKLTSNSITCSYPLLKDKIRMLVSSSLYKLLIIFDDVVDTKDVTEYLEVFSNCKTILTTRKQDTNIIIPCKRCFDVGSMKMFEAAQLLTWQIAQLATLSANDADKIQQLAKDLYFWPLLLSLVRGQLYVHCTEWKQSPTNAILNVQRKLKDKGLTAFDPQYINKENAVKASINASLELLSNKERFVLFLIVSGAGIGSCVLKDCIFKLSKVSYEEFEALIENLWSHGLVNFENVTLDPEIVAYPCIEIHDVIAQYIIEEMPYDYLLFLSKLSISDSFHSLSLVMNQGGCDSVSAKTFGLTAIDVFFIACIIRTMAIITRASQIKFSLALDSLIESYADIVSTNAVIKYFEKKPSLSQIYGSVKESCRIIQSMLVDNRCDEALAWISEYIDSHPYLMLAKNINILNTELTDECKHNPQLVAVINKTIGSSYKNDAFIGVLKMLATSCIQIRRIMSDMIEAGATVKEMIEVWNEGFDSLDVAKSLILQRH